MKGFVAVVVSLVVHAVVLLRLSSPPVPQSPPRAEPTSFDIIEIASPPALPLPAAAGRGSGRGAASGSSRGALRGPGQEPANPPPDPTPGDVITDVPTGEEERAPSPQPSPASQERGNAAAGVDVGALVHARLAAAAERCYPAAARRFRQRGTVTLSFCGDANASIVDGAIKESSGAPLLDAAAQGCVLAQADPLPKEAATRCFAVPVRFGAP